MDIVKLIPECKDNIWGGTKLKTKYGKKTDKALCAESWELSFHPDGLTRLEDGKSLAESVTKADLGTKAIAFSEFPVLVKMIDANETLSVQVHPDDAYAREFENSLGKTEMWYVVEAEVGAGIYLGLNRAYTKEEVWEAIENETLCDLLTFYPAKVGDCFFIPAGTVHAIASGCLICEVQQSSNIVYRFYDHGRGRQLHLKQAFDVAKLEPYVAPTFPKNVLAQCPYFRAERVCVNGETNLCATGDSFHCLTCIQGEGQVNGKPVQAGDSFFVPASFGSYTLTGDMQLIKTDIP